MEGMVSSRFLAALKAAVNRNVNPNYWQDSGSSESYSYRVKKGGGPTRKENPKCDRPTFLIVWLTHMSGETMWFTVCWTHNWWKCKLRIALKAMVIEQLTKNKSYKCTPIFHSAQLRRCSIIISLYPVNQSICKQAILPEYKIERHSTTTKTVFYLPLLCLSDE